MKGRPSVLKTMRQFQTLAATQNNFNTEKKKKIPWWKEGCGMSGKNAKKNINILRWKWGKGAGACYKFIVMQYNSNMSTMIHMLISTQITEIRRI